LTRAGWLYKALIRSQEAAHNGAIKGLETLFSGATG